MATLANIGSNVWGISTIGYGVIAEGLTIIRQSIDIILRTPKGSDPLRPEFGSNVHKFVDTPVLIAIPNIKKEIIEALELWEKRIKVVSIKHKLEEIHNPVFFITYSIIDESIIEEIIFEPGEGTSGGNSGEIILQAFFPPNPNNYRYQINLSINNQAAQPTPDTSGFATIQQMFDWITANWFFYGRWYLLADRIVCYMKAEGVSNASLSISLLSIKRIEAVFPYLPAEQKYKTSLIINGNDAEPLMPETFTTPADVLLWAQENWGYLGTWGIEGFTNEGQSVFTQEFSIEFGFIPDGYRLVLVSEIQGITGNLTIRAIL